MFSVSTYLLHFKLCWLLTTWLLNSKSDADANEKDQQQIKPQYSYFHDSKWQTEERTSLISDTDTSLKNSELMKAGLTFLFGKLLH